MKQLIYAELEALLDTRIATASLLNPQAAVELLENPLYRVRDSDEMGMLTNLITNEAYAEAYKKRSVETLMAARPTPMTFFLLEMVQSLEKQYVTGDPSVTGVEVVINYWPYELTQDECDMLVLAMIAHGTTIATIRTVSIPIWELTMETIRDNGWVAMIMYNFREWAEYVIPKIDEKTKLNPSVTMYAPQLLATVNHGMTEDAARLPNGVVLDPFQATKMMLSMAIAVEFLPTENYSLMELPPMDENDNESEEPQNEPEPSRIILPDDNGNFEEL